MLLYLYDGTPLGLITALAAAIKENGRGSGTSAGIRPGHGYRPGLFDEARRVETDQIRAGAFLRFLSARLPRRVFEDLFLCCFTGEEGMEDMLLAYTRLLLQTGGRAAGNWADETVRTAHRLSGRVLHEVQRLHGFIRFSRLDDGTYYSRVEPDHPILPLLAPHFAARFADQRWLIHDLRRGNGVYYDGSRWHFLPEVMFPAGPGKAPAVPEAEEDGLRNAWREYCRRVAIEERRNPRLQRQRMPKRYWKNMTEMNGDEMKDP